MRQSRVEDVLPLSPLQEGLLFHALYDEQAPDVYTVQFALDLDGEVDPEALRNAIAVLLQRHANLRAGFRQRKNGETVQVIAREVEIPFTEHGLSTEPQAAEIAAADRAARFDLETPPLLRFTLIKLGERKSRLLVTNHHILLDGWSMPLVVKELFHIYACGDATALPRVTPYKDYLAWLSHQDSDAARESWRRVLAGVADPTLLAPAETTPGVPARVDIELSEELTNRLQREARGRGLTLNSVVQGAWGLLLGRLTGRDDVVFGATVSGRPGDLRGVESMIGLFINTLPVRVRLDPARSLVELLAAVQEQQADVLGHQYLRLTDIQNTVGIGELFDTLTVFENYPLDPDALELPGTALKITAVEGRDATHYPLTLVILPGKKLTLRLDYRTDVFDEAGAGETLDRLKRVLDAVIAKPDTPVGRIDVLSDVERHQVLVHRNDTEHDTPVGTLTGMFAAQVARTPHATASGTLTYAQLNARANQVAHKLISMGVTRETRVALLQERSIDLIVSILAILKAGGVYVPLDARYPVARLELIMRDSNAKVLLADQPVRFEHEAEVLPVGEHPDQPETDPELAIFPDQPAYVMFTSGSTGTPKGVAVTHQGVVSLAFDRCWSGGNQQRVLVHSPHAFDASTYELWIPLLTGGELVVAPAGELSIHELGQLISDARITSVFLTAGLFRLLAEESPDSLAGVREVWTGGDVVPAAMVRKVLAVNPSIVVGDAYGPTEITMMATYHQMRTGDLVPDSVPIGRPLDNTRVYVLDSHLLPVPPGAVGELYIAGAGLARGYLEQPALTAERFVADPFGPGRMYRTGDLVRWTPEGTLAFMGRADDQVKVRGFRIELDEIEAVLGEHPSVAQVAVLVREDKVKQIVAYVVPNGAADWAELKAHVAARLPEYMVPAAMVTMDALPLTEHGKLDRKALPAPDFSALSVGRAPSTPQEETLCELFADVLGVQRVGADDSFFDLGGDSIISIQLVSRARKAGLVITPRDVFERRTPAALALIVTQAEAVTEDPDAGIGAVPLPPIVHWLHERGGPINDFHQAMTVPLPDGVTTEQVTAAAQTLVDHHDALRMRLTRAGVVWALEVQPRGTVKANFTADLDPEAGVMTKFTLAGNKLHIALHHLVVDGVSWRILLPDLLDALQGKQLESVGMSYRRWAEQQVALAQDPARLNELETWIEILAPVAHLGDRPLAATDTVDSVHSVTLELPAGQLLTNVPAAFHAGVNDVLLATFAIAFARWRGEPALIDLESHGRYGDADLSRTVGWFTNLYPVRLDAGDLGVNAAVKQVKEQLRAVPDNGVGYGLLRYLNPQTASLFAGLAKPEIGFNYLGRFSSGDSDGLGGGIAGDMPVPHALEINAYTRDDTFVATLSWPGDLMTADAVQELAEAWTQALGEAAAAPGGHTPSDFPLVALPQGEVEAVEAQYPNLTDVLPLSPLQEGMLFHALYDQHATDVYTVQLAIDLNGPVDKDKLQAAARTLLGRHANLRAGFVNRGPVQVIVPEVELPWSDHDLSDVDAVRQPATVDLVLAEDRERRFDLAKPPLLRFTLIKLAADRYKFVLTNHHILLDGWSAPLLARELFETYAGGDLGAVAPYRDYLAWLVAQDRAAAKEAWRAELDGFDEPTLLAPAAQGQVAPDKLTVDLPVQLTTDLAAAARKHGLTVNTVVQGAWGLLLGALTGRSDVVFGATVSGRPPEIPGVESMVGLFINTLPVRVQLDAGASVLDMLTRLQERQSTLMAHQYISLTELDVSFDSLTVFESYPLDPDAMSLPGTGLRITGVDGRDATHYPVSLIVMPGEQWTLRLDYRPDLYSPEAAQEIVDRLVRLLEGVVRQPDQQVGAIDILTSAERKRLLADWNGTVRPTPEGSIQQRFAEQVARTPDATALIAGDTKVTYRELDQRANRLARKLIDLGVRPESNVAILQDRSVELVVSTLAILKAGGAYVPLDARYPASRLEMVLEQTDATVLLVDREVTFVHNAHVLNVSEPLDGPDTDPGVLGHSLNLAYVMYTSGSTGVPKGVAVTHFDVLSLADDHCWHGTTQDRILLHSPHAFDASTYELWVSLLHGRELVVAPAGDLDIRVLAGVITEHRITGLWLTAGLFRLLVEEDPECFASVREVWSGGDVVPAAMVKKVLETNPSIVFGDGYGPTETTTFATHHLMRSGDPLPATIPIGDPLDNMRCYVLDSRLRLVLPGVNGELYIAGAGVARGYLGRPAVTAERFVADPFGPGRMYRTGDVVRWTQNGVLEFVGRADEQVKIRGFRIELGEIESVLARHPAVSQAAVIVREDRPGDKRVVAYLVAETADLRDYMAGELPEYMVPSAFVLLDTLPITTNGKLDRRALPEPEYTSSASREARTPQEEVLCGLFAEVLGLPKVGIDDGFFELGGHSLLATRLVSRIRSAFGVELAIRHLFEAPTVAALVDQIGRAGGARKALRPMDRPELIPASYGQRRLWFLNRLEGANSPYKIPVGLRFSGRLDRDALQAALYDVVERHESLRTVYPEVDGEPHQRVLDAFEAAPDVPVVETTEAELKDEMLRFVWRGFDLSVDPPLRAQLFELSPEEHVLLFVLHHIAGDGWSMAPLARDFSEAYTARLRGGTCDREPLPVQYADYSLWQHEVMGSEDDPDSQIAGQVRFWSNALAGIPEQLELPADRPRPQVSTYEGGTLWFEVDPDLHKGLTDLVREHQTSLFMVMQAALAALLTRLGAGTDIPIGSPIAGRTDDALDELVGFFVNTLVLRTDTSGDPTFAELLARVRDAGLAAYAHQELPFERLVEVLNPARSLSYNPLFQVMLVLQNNAEAELALPDLSVSIEQVGAHSAQFDLSVDLTEKQDNGGITGRLDFSTDLFDESTAVELQNRFIRLLTAIVADTSKPISTLPILAETERNRLLVDWNATERPGEYIGVVERVREFAATQPDAVALVDDRGEVTYAELVLRADAVARQLEPGGIAGVLASRSARVPTAVLGVLGAGAAYVPLDPRAPQTRSAGLLADSGARWLLTDPEHHAQALELAEETSIEVIVLDEATSSELTPVVGRPGDLAYVIFTSGSTGKPKGAMVHRAGMVNHLLAKLDDLEMSTADSLVQNAPLTFDISVWQMLAGLVAGGRVRVVSDDTALDPMGLFQLTQNEQISVLEVVPSLLRTALDAWDAGAEVPELSDLRWLMVTGEALPALTCERWFARFPDIPLVNAYGPTECSDDVTHAILTAKTQLGDARVPIGRAIRNTQLYVLDDMLEPVPAGVAGELHVGGAGVGFGYLGDPVKTANAFVPNPFSDEPGARLYKTGDRVRYRQDGQLEFLGRNDHQVKIRGQRIELGEVEAALRALPGVTDSVVTVNPDPAGQNRLVGYLVGDTDPRAARAELAAVLPEAMVPSVLVPMANLPLTPNGKVDRKALPAPDFGAVSGGRGPRTPQEEILCTVFAEVLGLPRVGIDDDFFDLGGHSLLATRLVNRIRSLFGVELPIRGLFENPTVVGLAAAIAEAGGAGTARRALKPLPRPEVVPLSYAQRRLWFLNRFEGAKNHSSAYNVPLALRLTGELNVDALRDALRDLIGRHETLRTIFPEIDGEPRQVVLVGTEPDFTDCDDIAAVVRQDFDLTAETPLRVRLQRVGDNEHILLLLMHHIASDGLSAAPLAADLAEAYAARCAGRAPGWRPLPAQYADYALWQRDVLGSEDDENSPIAQQLTYWRTALAALPDQLDIPSDRPRPAVSSGRGDSVSVTIDARLHEKLAELARDTQASLFMVVQAALAALLTSLGAGTDVPIGSPIAGRTDEALDGLIGFFVNTLVLRTNTDGDPTFADLVARVRETDLAAYANQDLPFERLVEAVNPARSLSRHPLFQVVLAFQNHTDLSTELPGLTIAGEPVTTGAAKFDLSVTLGESRDEHGAPAGITGRVDFRTDMFDAATVQRFADRLVLLLAEFAADPAKRIHEVELLDEQERRRMLVDWNDTATEVPDLPLPELFQQQVMRTPDAIALWDNGHEYTYADLNERANRFARFLAGLGVGPERFVAVALPRSLDLVVSLLGVLKAGAAYVPVDPDYPIDRIAFMLSDTKPALVVTNAELEGILPGGTRILVDEPSTMELIAACPATDVADADRLSPLKQNNPAYVIYTSGSTGRPKGVVIEHRSLTDYLTFAGADYEGVQGTAILHSPISFDLTVTAMYVPLTVGGTVLVSSLQDRDDTAWEALGRRECTFVKATPSHLPLLNALPPEYSPSRELLLGGELLLGELVDEWRAKNPETVVLNMYGPTETTVNCTEYRIEPGQQIPAGPLPIGRPLDNTQAYVLDEHLRLVPPGVPGELYVAGNGLARGYLNRPEMTSAKFVANPFGPAGSRMYRTGDVVRWNSDGNLYFLRRVDDQVKLRGFRIELGEIESVIAKLPEVATASVIVREDRPGDQRLVAYLVLEPGMDAPENLRKHMSGQLPEYMVPSAYLVIDDLPLTPNGKVDRKALPAPDHAKSEGRRPRNDRERQLAGLFADVLGLPEVTIDDGFFELGGHSLLATKLISRVRATFEVDMAIRTLFEAPTVAQLAERLGQDDGDAFDVLLPLRTTGTGAPVFCVHPASGFAWSYAGLMRHIDRPIYGLQSRGMTGEERLPSTVVEAAADYIAEIRAVQPDGPYHLLGWSYGGMIAHEMALQLQADGQEVALLALLDAFPKDESERAPRAFLDERELLLAFLDLAGYDSAELRDGPLDRAMVAGLLREQGGVLSGLTEDHLKALHRVFENNSDLARDCVPGNYRGDMVLFTAELDRTADVGRWAPHVDGSVEVHEISCKHNDMTQPVPLGEIGRVLAQRLA